MLIVVKKSEKDAFIVTNADESIEERTRRKTTIFIRRWVFARSVNTEKLRMESGDVLFAWKKQEYEQENEKRKKR